MYIYIKIEPQATDDGERWHYLAVRGFSGLSCSKNGDVSTGLLFQLFSFISHNQ